MKESKIKTNKGITLIALVITIIVLLILAGVTIAMITGENGILTKANNSKNETATTQQEARDMYASVKKNEGFYIGRYEAGNDTDGKVVVQKNANVYNNISWSSTGEMQDSETATSG